MPHPLPDFATSPWWQILFWATYYLWIAAEIWLIVRDRHPVPGVRTDRGSRAFLILTLNVCLGAALSFGYISGRARIPMPPAAAFALGISQMWAGIALRFWSVHVLGKYFRTTVFLQEGHQLVEAGPYRFVRNPSYTGGLITLLGIGLAIGNWVSLALAASARSSPSFAGSK